MAGESRSLIYRAPWVYELAMRLLYGRFYEARYRSLAALIPDHASVVELCCGPGVLYKRHLSSQAVRYIGLDASPAFVRSLHAAGVDSRKWDVRSARPLPRADYVLMQASLYHFMPEAQAIVARMLAAATERVIVAEPIRNLSSVAGPVGPLLARLANPGDGAPVERYTEATLSRVLERFNPRIERTFLLPGGRERAYILSAGGQDE